MSISLHPTLAAGRYESSGRASPRPAVPRGATDQVRAYLQREGVTRDSTDGRMFDASSEMADEHAFAERCEDDRHHFRFIISPEDAARLDDLRTFTRELMRDAERDLGTALDWVAIDHWNTDNAHMHLLIRGVADDGKDLVISRAYISRGFRDRAAERVTVELGPRTEHEIRSALESDVEAERWTSLDRALRDRADEGAGIADLRPGETSDGPELRRLMLGRAAKLERFGLAEQIAPSCWTLKPRLEETLRELGDSRRHHQDDAPGDDRRRPRARRLGVCIARRQPLCPGARPPRCAPPRRRAARLRLRDRRRGRRAHPPSAVFRSRDDGRR